MKYLLALAILSFAGSFYYNQVLTHALREDEALLRKQSDRLRFLESRMAYDRQGLALEMEQEQKAISSLQQQLQVKRMELNSLTGRVEVAQNFADGGSRLSIIQLDLKHKKEVIDNLNRQLKEMAAQRSDAESRIKLVENQGRLNQKQAMADAQERVQIEQQKLKNLNDQLAQLKVQKYDLSSREQIKQLQPQIQEQKLIIEKLKGEKQVLDSNWNTDRNASQISDHDQIVNLKADEKNLRDRLAVEKAEYGLIETRLQDERRGNGTQSAEINRLNKQLSNDESDIKQLQELLAGHQIKLRELQAQMK